MSTSKDFSKVYNQLKNKKGKWIKYQKHNSPKQRKFGRLESSCRFTKNTHGIIGQYGLKINRSMFKNKAEEVGFKKLD